MAAIEKEYTVFDKTQYFNEECLPLVQELLKKCYEGKIPYFFTAAIKNDAKSTQYFSDGIMTGSNDIELKEDHIKYHMMVNDGCVARPAREEIELDTDLLFGGMDDF